MCVMNQNDREMEIATDRFHERLQKFSRARNFVDGATTAIGATLKIPAKTVLVLGCL